MIRAFDLMMVIERVRILTGLPKRKVPELKLITYLPQQFRNPFQLAR